MKKLLFFLVSLVLVTSCKKSDSDSNSDSNLNPTVYFSVSESEKVVFAKSNLQYQASKKKWRFADCTWDFIGRGNGNISSTYSGWIDLFGWGTGDNPTNSLTSDVDYPSFYDWGNYCELPTPEGTTGKWRTLTKDEWSYVMFERTTPSGARYAKANLNNINGIIIVPDTWKKAIYGLNNTDDEKADFSVNVISVKDWESILEPAGCVFLPVAGFRQGTGVYDFFSNGDYWSSTPDNLGRGFRLRFVSGNCEVNSYYRCHGYSVRLVADVKK